MQQQNALRSATEIAEKLLLFVRAVSGVITGGQAGERDGLEFSPAFAFLIDENGEEVNAVLFGGVAVARRIADHQNMIGRIAKLEHFGDTVTLAAAVLREHDVRVRKQTNSASILMPLA